MCPCTSSSRRSRGPSGFVRRPRLTEVFPYLACCWSSEFDFFFIYFLIWCAAEIIVWEKKLQICSYIAFWNSCNRFSWRNFPWSQLCVEQLQEIRFFFSYKQWNWSSWRGLWLWSTQRLRLKLSNDAEIKDIMFHNGMSLTICSKTIENFINIAKARK